LTSADPADQLCLALLADAGARARLRGLRDHASMIAAAEALAAEQGLRLPGGALEARLREPVGAAHLTLGTTMPAAGRVLRTSRAPAGFMPIAIDGLAATVRWCDMTGLTCDDAFLEESIGRALREPYRRLMVVETGLQALAEAGPGHAPAGLVFHTSRSGSTLVCRLLRAAEGTVVLAEPPVIDHLLQAPELDPATRQRCLAGLFAALAQPLRPAHRRTVIKLDAWATREMAIVLAAAGNPPWAFVFREPAAVVASQLRMPGLVGAAGLLAPAMFGLTLDEALAMDQASYCATVYACLASDVLTRPVGEGCLIDHAQLPGAIDRVLSHFGLSVTASERQAINAAAMAHAKRPNERYDPQHDARVTPEIRAAVRGRAASVYSRLRDAAGDA
jgi:hypothetical protein